MRYKHLYPFASHYLDLGGLHYHYIDEGQGPAVVMVHGNPTWSFYYRSLVLGLRGSCRCVAPDHMGCGLSDKPGEPRYEYSFARRIADFTALMDHLDLRDITLVVHDWGGPIGLSWAVEHADRVARVVVTNTSGFFPPPGKPMPWMLRLIRDIPALATPLVLGLNLFSGGAAFLAPKRRLSRDVRAGLTAPYDTWSNRLATLRFVQDIPWRPSDPGYPLVKSLGEKLSRLADKPMLILWGRHDFVFDDTYLAEWRRRCPWAAVRVFEQAGHYLLEDAPGPVLASVRAFIGLAG